MTFVLPAALPKELLERGLDTSSRYVWQTHQGIAFHPDGRGYLHSEVAFRVDDDLGKPEIRAEVITMLDRSFSITRVAVMEQLYTDLATLRGEYVFNNEIQPLAVTALGEVLFTTSKNRTFVYDDTLAKRLAAFDPLAGGPVGVSNVVGHAIVRDTDAVSIVDAIPRFSDRIPALTPVASIRAVTDLDAGRSHVGKLVALDRDRTLVSAFSSRSRGGFIDHGSFRFVVIARDGHVVATLPLGAADTPYGKLGDHSSSYAAHGPLDSWITRSDSALHVFDRDGARTHRIALGDDPSKAMQLLGVGPHGELIWLQPKHRVLVVSDPVSTLRELDAALVEINSVYAAELARLKKAVPIHDGWWCGFEPTTPRALAGKAKKKKADAPRRDAPPALVATTPQQAMAQAPRDLDSIAVYADSIASTEPELSEYINVGVQIERAATPELRARKDELWRNHGEQWLNNWNSPTQLFAARFHGIAGLPASVRLDEELPRDLDAFERQVAQFPIATLSTYKIGQRGLAGLTSLALLRRLESLIISATSKVKLGKQTLAWLQTLQLSQLKSISLSGVEVTPAGIRAMVDSMPALSELRMFDCFVTVEGIVAVAESAVAANLEKLDLSYNSIGSAAMRTFASFPKLRELDLRRNDIGDDICETAPPRMSITTLDIDDNKRLTAKGLAWLVAAMPELRTLTLAREMSAPTIRALAPIAEQLENVHGSWMPLESKRALIRMLGPKLRELTFSSDCQDLDLGKLTSLTKLELGDITDTDVNALTTLPFDKLEYLEICSAITDDHALRFLDATNLPALRTLYIRSRTLTTAGVGALLKMSQLTELQIMYAKLNGASQLKPRAHPFVLEISHHNLSRVEADRLRAVWGDRLLLL